MKANWNRTAAISAILLLAAVTVGCPDSDIVEPSTGQILLTVEAVGGAGRYDTAVLSVSQFKLEGVGANASLAGQDLGLLTIQANIQLNQAGEIPVDLGTGTPSRPLSPGTYQLNGLVLSVFQLIDSSGPYCNLSKPIGCPDPDCCVDCLDAALSKLNSQGIPPALSDRVRVRTAQRLSANVQFSSPPTIVITPKGESTLRMTVDAAGIVDFFASKFNCLPTGTCFSNGNLQAPCLDTFPPSIPPGQLEPFFSFQ